MSDPFDSSSVDEVERTPGDVLPPPNVTLDDVSGLDAEIAQLRQSLVDPALMDRHDGIGASGVLIHGPSGVGKTFLTRAVVGELGFDHLLVTPSDLPLEDPDACAAMLQGIVERAREHSPCVVVFEQFDTIAPPESGTVGRRPSQVGAALRTALDEVDAAEDEVLVLATADRLADVERTVRRAGRIDLVLGLDRPDEARRRAVLRDELDDLEANDSLTVDRTRIDLDGWAEATEGFSVVTLASGVQRAGQSAIAESKGSRARIDDRALRVAFRELTDSRDGLALGPPFETDEGERDELWETTLERGGPLGTEEMGIHTLTLDGSLDRMVIFAVGPEGADYDLYVTLDGRDPTTEDYDERTYFDTGSLVEMELEGTDLPSRDRIRVGVHAFEGSGEYVLWALQQYRPLDDDTASTDSTDDEDDVEFDGVFEDDESDRRGSLIGEDAEAPSVSYDDIGNLEHAKQRLREVVEWPREYPDRFESLDVDPATGILLNGPPGTGKTMLAKAVANETDSHFVWVKGPEVFDKYFGESERFIRELFEEAREEAPAVVFFDEFDSIAAQRGGYNVASALTDSIVNQLLSELDGLDELEDVVVIAATNRIEAIDPAIRRPGRFGVEIEVGMPDAEGRREIFRVHLADRTVAEDVTPAWLADRIDGRYSGADIAAICREAAMIALREGLSGDRDPERVDEDDPDATITREHFQRGIEAVDPTRELLTPDGEDTTPDHGFR